MEKVLALDLSTKRSGWAYYEAPDRKISYGVIASSSADIEKRIGIMRNGIIELLKQFDVKTIIIEEVHPDETYNNHTGKVLTWLQGVIAVAVYEYDKKINVEFIGPSSWRSKLGIQGYRIKREQQKKIDIDYINQDGYNLTYEQDDEADALCILKSYVKGNSPQEKKRLKPIGSEESAF